MKVSVTVLKLLALASVTDAFLPSNQNHRQIVSTSTSQLFSDTSVSEASTESSKSGVKSLGLLTFDLDDTLYPIAQIVQDANGMLMSATHDEAPNYISTKWLQFGSAGVTIAG